MGIGLACAEACLQAGARVMICARTEEPLRLALDGLKRKGHSDVEAHMADVASEEQLDRVLRAMADRFGGLDGLVHCAAILGPIGQIGDVDTAEWMETIRVNLFGTFLIVRQASNLMKRQGGGRMVLLSGGGAAAPFPNYTAYACSKVGVVRFTETAAEELRPFDIELNCLAPGFVVTRMHEATIAAGEKAGKEYFERTEREIRDGGMSPTVAARAAVFLLSDRAKKITGKFVAAVYDNWDSWETHLNELRQTDVFTLRRILPTDRGMDWQ